MISSAVRTKFDSVLRGRHLADPASRFADPDFFDEVPLYARYEEVKFLKEFGDVNSLLIELSLDYLERVASKQHTGTVGRRVASKQQTGTVGRFVAITVISDDEYEYVVPSIFVCNRKAETRLKNLHLSSPSKGFGKRIERFVKEANRRTTFSVLEDRSTVPGDVRVFIGYKSPPTGFVGIQAFVNGFAKTATSNL
jgi:hypothetical protein